MAGNALETILEDARRQAGVVMSCDGQKSNSEIDLDQILSQIRAEAETLIHSGRAIKKKRDYTGSIKTIDHHLKQYAMYRTIRRPFVSALKKGKAAWEYRRLLAMPDGVFIDTLYRKILCREPDSAGKEDNLTLLANGQNRQTMLLSFVQCDEANRIFCGSLTPLAEHIMRKCTR